MTKEININGVENVPVVTRDNIINLVLKTFAKKKQVLIFNNSKRSAEATAEKIADAVKVVSNKDELLALSEKILGVLSTPTKQCKRLAKCIAKGAAFHHSGLVGAQRTLIEDAFKAGVVKAISSTPTLAAGMNLPAYKVIIKDYKRYSSRGMADIPVLEYHQMTGRAGRPGFEDIGRSVVVVKSEDEHRRVNDKYVNGEPEEIISKLAVEPILKMYTLALISMNMINTKDEIEKFFKNTLYAKQYGDINELLFNVFRIIKVLKGYDFVDEEDGYYVATKLGKRVSELYLNPDTANYIIEHLPSFAKEFRKEFVTKTDVFSLVNFVCNTVEMKPLFRINKAEEEVYTSKLDNCSDDLIVEYDPFESDYMEFMQSLKTTDILCDWIDEKSEDFISEKYKITPGELKFKTDTIDWLLYCVEQIAMLKKEVYFKNYVMKLRVRFKYGIKQELLTLISLKGIGRVRARKLFEKGLKNIRAIKKTNEEVLAKIVGVKTAKMLKEQTTDENLKEDKPLIGKPKEIKYHEVKPLTEVEVEGLLENYKESEVENEHLDEKKKYGFTLNDFF